MATQDSAAHEEYYVPASSGMAISATIGLILSVFGAASVLNDMTFGEPGAVTNSWTILTCGLLWFIATLFMWPIGYYFMNTWLQSFPFRTSINISTFLLTGFIVLFVSITSISWQIVRAAKVNPVTTLRNE